MRILGVDIGASQIKLVEVDSTFGRYEIHEYHEAKIAPGSDPFAILAPLVQGLPKKPDRIAVALRSSQSTFRNFTFPTKDKKAITSSVGFELEDDIPFPLDQAAYDYTLLSTSKSESQVHVATTFRQTVTALISSWTSHGIEPDLITTEAWGFRHYLSKILSPEQHAHPVAIIDIGASRTLIYIQWKGVPLVVREVPWGGNDLTAKISEKYELSWDDAEKNKLDHGFVLPPGAEHDISPEQRALSELVIDQLKTWQQDFQQAELTSKNLSHLPLKEVFLTGGGSLLPGIDKTLGVLLDAPVTPLRTLSRVATGGITYSEPTDALFLIALSTALCLAGTDRASAIQFRKGTLAKASATAAMDWSQLRKPLLTAAAVLSCFLISTMVEISNSRTQIEEIDSRLEKGLKQFYGQISGSAIRGYLSNPESLTSGIQKELTKSRDLSKLYLPNPRSPLDFLRELSNTIPRDVVLDLQTFKVGANGSYLANEEQNVSLTWVASAPTVVDRVAALTSSKISTQNRSKPEEIPGVDETASKRWRWVVTGRPTGDAYGRQ